MGDTDDGKFSMKYDRGVPVAGVAALLERLLIANVSCPASDAQTKERTLSRRFESTQPSPVSVYGYVKRLRDFARFDMSFVVALIYIDRLQTAPDFELTDLNVHRIILVCTMIAEKYFHDVVYLNSLYAHVGGVGLKELNCFEAILLKKLNWRMGVSAEEYDQKRLELSRVVFRSRELSTVATLRDSKRACIQVTEE
jgi:hypothetical protein